MNIDSWFKVSTFSDGVSLIREKYVAESLNLPQNSAIFNELSPSGDAVCLTWNWCDYLADWGDTGA